MQINSVLNGRSDPLQSSKRVESLLSPGAKTTPDATAAVDDAGVAGANGQGALTPALAPYDLTHITPTEISAMINRLRQSGAISEQDLRDLGQIRSDLEQAEIGAHEPVNLLEFYKDLVGKLQKRFAAIRDNDPSAASQRALLQQELTTVQKRQQWVQKLATVRESADHAGVDLAA